MAPCRNIKWHNSARPYQPRYRTAQVLLPLWMMIVQPALVAAEETPAGKPTGSELTCPAGFPTAPSAAASPPPTFDVAKSRRRDRSCFVAPDAVAKQSKANPFTLVDVRSANDFEQMRIPGSLNIPLHLVKTKAFLKTRNIVLINEGRTSVDLEDSCRSLKQAGFQQVSILENGLYGWGVRKKPLEGDSSVTRTLNKLKPGELFAERAYDDWVVINLSGAPGTNTRETQNALPRKVVTLKTTSKAIPIAEIRSAIRAQEQTNPNARIVIAADSDAVYQKLERELSGGHADVFYLVGGLSKYREHVTMQIAARGGKDKPAKLSACHG
jgi:rhodanese-related sulfurtransferase